MEASEVFFMFVAGLIAAYLVIKFLGKYGSTEPREYSQQATRQTRDYDDDEDTFITKLVGVTFENEDGTDRQKIIKKCRIGEPLKLIRDYNNSHSKYAIRVCRETVEQIGHIAEHVALCFDSTDRSLAYNLDMGQYVSAKINSIDSFYDGKTIYTCTIKVSKGNYPECFMQDTEAMFLIRSTKGLENKDVEQSINNYRKAAELLKAVEIEFEKINERIKPFDLEYQASPSAKYPINRLSLLLERSNRHKECLEVIEQYSNIIDRLSKTDCEAITKRKARIEKILKKTTA